MGPFLRLLLAVALLLAGFPASARTAVCVIGVRQQVVPRGSCDMPCCREAKRPKAHACCARAAAATACGRTLEGKSCRCDFRVAISAASPEGTTPAMDVFLAVAWFAPVCFAFAATELPTTPIKPARDRGPPPVFVSTAPARAPPLE
jgi:hypothetical protein